MHTIEADDILRVRLSLRVVVYKNLLISDDRVGLELPRDVHVSIGARVACPSSLAPL